MRRCRSRLFSPIARVPRRRGFRRPPIARGRCRRGGDERRADSPRERHHRAQHVVGLVPVLLRVSVRVASAVPSRAAAGGGGGGGGGTGGFRQVRRVASGGGQGEVRARSQGGGLRGDDEGETVRRAQMFRRGSSDVPGVGGVPRVSRRRRRLVGALRRVQRASRRVRDGATLAMGGVIRGKRRGDGGEAVPARERDILHRRAALLPAVPPRRAAPRGGGARRGARGDSQGRPPHRRR